MSLPAGWRQVTFDEVVTGWLSAGGVWEGDKRGRTFEVPETPRGRYQQLVQNGFLFLRFIPPCDWFQVEFSQVSELLALRLIQEESWAHALAGGERALGARADLSRATAAHAERVHGLVGHPQLEALIDGRVVLFGHEVKEPMSILDGNHRLLALARRLASGGEPMKRFRAFVGLGQGPCRWHGDPEEWVERPGREPGERRFILKVW